MKTESYAQNMIPNRDRAETRKLKRLRHTSSMSEQETPSPVKPGGQGPQRKKGSMLVLVHWTPGKQGLGSQALMGLHTLPSPVCPGGHGPHR